MKPARPLTLTVLIAASTAVAQTAPLKPAAKPAAANSTATMAKPDNIDDKLPNVLLIGDSISIGYTRDVRKLLAGKANIYRPPTNCGPTTTGLKQINAWLSAARWDVIHFNFGLHDLKFVGEKGDVIQEITSPGAHRQVSIEDYEKNLRQLVAAMKKTKAKLIWCTTTPVPEGAKGRLPGDEVRYNETAAKVMKDEGVSTDDLYSFAKPRLAEIQKKADVHYTEAGSANLATAVAESITKALAK